MNFIKIIAVTFLVSLSSFAFAMDKSHCSEGLPLCLEKISDISESTLNVGRIFAETFDADIGFWKSILSSCGGSSCEIHASTRLLRNLIEQGNDDKKGMSSISLILSDWLRDVESFVKECAKSHCNKKLPSYIELISDTSKDILDEGVFYSKYNDMYIWLYEKALPFCQDNGLCTIVYKRSTVRNLIESTSNIKEEKMSIFHLLSDNLKNIESFVRECVK